MGVRKWMVIMKRRKMKKRQKTRGSISIRKFCPGGMAVSEWTHSIRALSDTPVVDYISKMYFSLWKPPEVSERMWSVNLDASGSGEFQTVGGHSGQPWE
jgi:hypothetical protein